MKSAVDDDDTGWGLGIPEKMRNSANWVDITQEFKGACKGSTGLCVFVNICACMKRTNEFVPFPSPCCHLLFLQS